MNISDLCITQDPISLRIADLILVYHIRPIERTMAETGIRIWCSEKSGYRPSWWDMKKGRSGTGAHCFLPGEFGATDWTANVQIQVLLEALIKYTDYTRFGVYPASGFIHCDYRKTKSGKRQVYNENWIVERVIE